MVLDVDVVRAAAALARVAITEEEASRYAGQLAQVVRHFEELAGVATEGVPPTTHAVPLACPLRDDRPAPPGDPEAMRAAAPARRGPFFTVPRGGGGPA